MFDDGKKKKIIILSVIGVCLLLLLLILLLGGKNNILNDALIEGNENGIGGIFNSNGNNGFDFNAGYGGSNQNSNNSNEEDVDVIIPSKKLSGKVDSYELSSNYGKLELLDGENKTPLEIKISGLVFDTNTNRVISPDNIKVGNTLSVYTYEDLEESKLDVDLVEAIIVSPKDNMGYVPIQQLNKEGKDFKFKSKGKEYVIEGKIYSALSGKEYDERQLSELENGDRVVYYGTEKDDKVLITKAYVYPNFS